MTGRPLKKKRPSSVSAKPDDVVRAESILEAVQLRKSGLSYEAIGNQMGLTKVTAFRYVQSYLSELRSKVLEFQQDVILLEIQRIDDLYKVAFEKAEKGDLRAIDTCLKIMERRAKLLGIDAATVIKTIPADMPDAIQGLTDDELDALRKSYSRN